MLYEAGTTFHRMTDPDGNTYALFTANLNMLDTTGIDLSQVDVFSGAGIKPGGAWTYSSEVLTEDLITDSEGTATVLAINGHSIWQQYTVVPIPGAVWLLGSGLIGLVGFRKKFKKV
jgi:hypothetical protein